MEDVFARQHTGEMRRTLTLVFYLAMIVVLAIVVWTHRYKAWTRTAGITKTGLRALSVSPKTGVGCGRGFDNDYGRAPSVNASPQ
jgi:hypothetical protein